jgi:hypothetical protein
VSTLRATAVALIAGLIGGALAGFCLIAWALVSAPPVNRAGEILGLIGALLVAQAGGRAAARLEPGFAARLRAASVLALTEAGISAAGAYWLFAGLRPQLLAQRYTAAEQALTSSSDAAPHLSAELARLAAMKPQALDASYQALAVGGLVGFLAVLLGAYGAFRAHALRRGRGPLD